ncbi:hypothetical protein GCM10007862_08130 [Dyella lipolytica]|uniref:Uncharacterized protein n=1 Tax=Dyella lipolytica TaxID=1867835 RepID=A0ABW8J019_9GAMM|nr:hypothetical protein [Dyella lipolytica]GLQ45762.1 hypothetical protein GCM10007862_08130 [Dyella lipolytica]
MLVIDPKDAPAVEDLSKRNVGKEMLIGVNHKVFTKGILQGPLDGEKIYITVDSEKVGNDLTTLFVDPK